MIGRSIGLGLMILLGGCAIRTAASDDPRPSAPEPLSLDLVPGNNRPVVPYIARLVPGAAVTTGDATSSGILEHDAARDRPSIRWQFEAGDDTALLWRSRDDRIQLIHCWDPDYHGTLMKRLDALFAATDTPKPALLDQAEPAVERQGVDTDEAITLRSLTLTHAAILEPRAGAAPRGVALLLSGLGGPIGAERALIRRLRRHGWCVVNVTTPMLAGPNVSQHLGGPRSSFRVDPATETAGMKPQRLPAEAVPLFDVGVLAGMTDTVLMATVRAAVDIMAHVERERPELAGRPRVMIGVSFGAVAAPAIASVTGPPDACILIGGGVNVISSLARFTSVRRLLERSWEPESGSAGRREFADDLFLAVCDLDPHHWAPVLAGRPVLQVHAMFDAIVPAATGDAYHMRLGRPERWSYPLGHLGLMFVIGFETGRLVDWIEHAVDDPGR